VIARDLLAVSGEDASTRGMKAGGYYDAHSEYQRRIVEGGDALIRSVVSDHDPGGELFTVADYGAGTGATSVHAVGTAISALRERDPGRPVQAFHNDVLTSDFSQLFRNIAGDDGYLGSAGGPVYAAAAGGSFFGQVLPDASVDLGMCSNAAHWFREQPAVAIGDGMYFSAAKGEARAKLAAQAGGDWLAFLSARAAELSPGGHLLVQGIGTLEAAGGAERVSASRLLEEMWRVAAALAEDGLLEREVLGSYVFPVYCRTPNEVAAPASTGGSLSELIEVVRNEVDEVANPYWEQYERDGDAGQYASVYTEFVRAFSESTLTTHLFEPGAGSSEPTELCDEYFRRLEAAVADDPDASRYEAWIVRTVFARKGAQ